MKRFVSVIMLICGCVAIYLLQNQSPSLPNIGHVEEWPLVEVEGKGADLLDKPKLIAFFYSNCPDICPTTMLDLKDLQQLLQEKGISQDQYLIVSVTLDPAYDTKERILQYREALGITNSNWLFLRGSEEETERFTRPFRFVYEENEDGFLTHSTSMYAVDSEERIRSTHDMAMGNKKVNIEEIAVNLIQLIEETE